MRFVSHLERQFSLKFTEKLMNFQIMQHAGGRKFIPALDETNQPLIFDNADKAAEAAVKLTKAKGIKYQPRPVAAVADWRQRERKRFDSGEYKPVIWAKEVWWKEIDGHFAHVSIKDPARVAFTPDNAKGEADRQTAMQPGKYLQQFFGDVLSPGQIRTYSMQHSTQFEQSELKFARTVEEIEHVYKVGPTSSCFAKTTKANLYGSGDFEVAYIVDAKGNVTARALCSVKNKAYPRIYGDETRLGAALTKAGYKLDHNGKPYSGHRVIKKWQWAGWYPDWWGGGGRDFKDDPENPELSILC